MIQNSHNSVRRVLPQEHGHAKNRRACPWHPGRSAAGYCFPGRLGSAAHPRQNVYFRLAPDGYVHKPLLHLCLRKTPASGKHLMLRRRARFALPHGQLCREVKNFSNVTRASTCAISTPTQATQMRALSRTPPVRVEAARMVRAEEDGDAKCSSLAGAWGSAASVGFSMVTASQTTDSPRPCHPPWCPAGASRNSEQQAWKHDETFRSATAKNGASHVPHSD